MTAPPAEDHIDDDGNGRGEVPAGRIRLLRPLARSLPALFSYLCLSVVLWWRVLQHVRTTTYGGNDAYLITWWLRWVPYSALHHHLPFRTGWLGHPYGVNAMWNTSVLVLGALASPVTEMAGPLVAYNMLMIAAPAASAWSCFLLARRLFGRGWPAFAAGLLYGFSPYFVGQSAGHLQMTWAVFPVLLTWLSLELLVFQTWSARRLGVLLGVTTGLQLGVSEELLASSACMAAFTVTVLAACRPTLARSKAGYAWRTLALAVLVAGLIDALPLYEQFFGPQRVAGQVQAQAPGADLLSFILPGPLQAWHLPANGHLVTRVLGGNLSEQTAYLGLPLLLLTAWAAVAVRRTGTVLLSIPIAIAAVLALGRHLVVGGEHLGLPLPADLLSHVPVLQSMLPVRFSLYVFLFSALLIAGWLSRPSNRHSRARVVVTAAAMFTLLPQQLPAFAVPVPAFFQSGHDDSLVPAGSVAFVAPYPGPAVAAGMLWQADANMRFRMVGGYFLGPGAHGKPTFGQHPGALAQAVSAIAKGKAVPSPDGLVGAAIRQEVVGEHIDEVIVGPMPAAGAAAHFVASVLRVKARWTGGVWFLKVRP